jgi:hypothetical protein
MVIAAASISSAVANVTGYYYATAYFTTGMDANSSYSPSWNFNDFLAPDSGYDKVATFIDNTSYSWHNTVRNTAKETIANWAFNGVNRKGYCRWYDSRGSGLAARCFIGNQS